MRTVGQWHSGLGTGQPGGTALVYRECHHYHTRSYATVTGYCGEPLPGGRSCLCRSKDRLSVAEADALGLGWP